MTYNNEPLTISHGMDVLGSDGEKVGDVADMRGDYVVVSKGFFFPTDYYIPSTAIQSVTDGKIYLDVTKDQVLNQGWDQEPVSTEMTTTAAPITDVGMPIQNPAPRSMDTGYTSDPMVTNDADTINVPLVEEELTATTREVERGGVRVEKIVTAEEQTLNVPVTEEHVNVTRRHVDRDVPVGETTFEDVTIEVPLHAEEVELEKRAHVVEEIEIAKEATTSTQQVTGTVRREDVRVTDSTGDFVDDDPISR